MFRTPGALSGAWADPLPSVPVSPDPKPQPPRRPTLSVAQAHAHAFNTPKGWETPVPPRASNELSRLSPPTINENSSDQPKWTLPYRRYDSQDLPYTAWEALGSPTSSVRDASRSSLPPSPSRSSIDIPSRTTRAGGSDVSRVALSEPRSLGSSYRTARTHQSTWKWANEVIPDPDFPEAPPPCLSPPLSSVASSSRQRERMRRRSRTQSVGDAEGLGIREGKENSMDVDALGFLDLLVETDPSLAVSEVGAFGKVGTVETVWGETLPECGLCKCEGLRHRYRIHGERCPLHIKSMKWGPTSSLRGEADAYILHARLTELKRLQN